MGHADRLACLAPALHIAGCNMKVQMQLCNLSKHATRPPYTPQRAQLPQAGYAASMTRATSASCAAPGDWLATEKHAGDPNTALSTGAC